MASPPPGHLARLSLGHDRDLKAARTDLQDAVRAGVHRAWPAPAGACQRDGQPDRSLGLASVDRGDAPGSQSRGICSAIPTRSTAATSASEPDACECGRRQSHRDTSPSMSGPRHRAEQAAPPLGPPRVRGLVQPRTTASNARIADAGSEATPSDWSHPVALSPERAAPCRRTGCLSTRPRSCPRTGRSRAGPHLVPSYSTKHSRLVGRGRVGRSRQRDSAGVLARFSRPGGSTADAEPGQYAG
jgi:hypothetical protein